VAVSPSIAARLSYLTCRSIRSVAIARWPAAARLSGGTLHQLLDRPLPDRTKRESTRRSRARRRPREPLRARKADTPARAQAPTFLDQHRGGYTFRVGNIRRLFVRKSELLVRMRTDISFEFDQAGWSSIASKAVVHANRSAVHEHRPSLAHLLGPEIPVSKFGRGSTSVRVGRRCGPSAFGKQLTRSAAFARPIGTRRGRARRWCRRSAAPSGSLDRHRRGSSSARPRRRRWPSAARA
jgi:hypothetical protein